VKETKMKRRWIIFLFTFIFLVNFGIISIFAQESKRPDASTAASESQEAPLETEYQQPLTATETESQGTPTIIEQEMQWLWGEVILVDINAKQMTVKYLDYETDTEREINIAIDEKTVFENVKSLEEIKPKDTVSIDYITDLDGKSIAKNISVEKNEGTQTQPEENSEEAIKAVPGLE
jgi:hypothetical protein